MRRTKTEPTLSLLEIGKFYQQTCMPTMVLAELQGRDFRCPDFWGHYFIAWL